MSTASILSNAADMISTSQTVEDQSVAIVLYMLIGAIQMNKAVELSDHLIPFAEKELQVKFKGL